MEHTTLGFIYAVGSESFHWIRTEGCMLMWWAAPRATLFVYRALVSLACHARYHASHPMVVYRDSA